MGKSEFYTKTCPLIILILCGCALRYSVCIRPEEGFCCVEYQVCPDEAMGFTFDTLAANTNSKQDDACITSTNSADYITIAESGQSSRASAYVIKRPQISYLPQQRWLL